MCMYQRGLYALPEPPKPKKRAITRCLEALVKLATTAYIAASILAGFVLGAYFMAEIHRSDSCDFPFPTAVQEAEWLKR